MKAFLLLTLLSFSAYPLKSPRYLCTEHSWIQCGSGSGGMFDLRSDTFYQDNPRNANLSSDAGQGCTFEVRVSCSSVPYYAPAYDDREVAPERADNISESQIIR